MEINVDLTCKNLLIKKLSGIITARDNIDENNLTNSYLLAIITYNDKATNMILLKATENY